MGRFNIKKKPVAFKKKEDVKENEGEVEPDVKENHIEIDDEKPTTQPVKIERVKLKTISKVKKVKFNLADKKKTDLKSKVLEQIKSSAENGETAKAVTFVNRTESLRLTNSALKSILKNKAAASGDSSTKKSSLVSQQIKKRDKMKLKKQAFQSRISKLKDQVKESKAKAKREKTVIVGDMKPMIDSLINSKESAANLDISTLFNESSVKVADLSAIQKNKKDIREKNMQREVSKPIMKESIRAKKMNNDLALFNELSTFSKFTQNPLELLKKTMK